MAFGALEPVAAHSSNGLDAKGKTLQRRAIEAAREAVEYALRQQVTSAASGAVRRVSSKARSTGGAAAARPAPAPAAAAESDVSLAVQLARIALELAAQPARESFKPAGALASSRQNPNPLVGVCLTSAPTLPAGIAERKASCSCGSDRAVAPDAIGRQILTLALQVVCDELADSGFLDESDRSTLSTWRQQGSTKAHSAPAGARPNAAQSTRSGAGSALRRAAGQRSPYSDFSEHSVADAGTQTWARVPSNLARLLAKHAISEALGALLETAPAACSAPTPSTAPPQTPLQPPDARLAASRCSSSRSRSVSFVPTESSVSIPFALDSYASSCCVDEAPPESLPVEACETALRALERALDELNAELAAPSGEQLVQLRALSQPPFADPVLVRTTPPVVARGAHSERASRVANAKPMQMSKAKANASVACAPTTERLADADAELLASCSLRVSSLAAGAIAYAMRELRSLMSASVSLSVCANRKAAATANANESRARVAHSEPVAGARVGGVGSRCASGGGGGSSSLFSRVSVRESLTQVSRNASGRRPFCFRGTRIRPVLSTLTDSMCSPTQRPAGRPVPDLNGQSTGHATRRTARAESYV